MLSRRDLQDWSDNNDLMMRAFARMAVNAHDAEDLAQETWLAALERPPGELRNPRGWLVRVARRKASRHIDRESRRRYLERDVANLSHEASPEDMRRQTRSLLACLPERYRQVLELRYLEGLSSEEIAHRLERPVTTVRSQLRRGLERLRVRAAVSRPAALTGFVLTGLVSVWAALWRPSSVALRTTALVAVFALAVPLVWSLQEPLSFTGSVVSVAGPVAKSVPGEEGLQQPFLNEQRRPLLAPSYARLTVQAPIDSSGAPSSELKILLERSKVGQEDSDTRLVTAGSNGRARVPGLEPGLWRLLSDRGHERWLHLEPGDTLIHLEVGRRRTVHGVVLATDERPIPGAVIWSAPAGHANLERRVSIADGKGRFQVDGLAPGEWLRAEAPAYVSACWTSTDLPEAGESFEQPLGLHLFASNGQIRGRVVDELDRPIAGARVRHILRGDPTWFHDGGVWRKRKVQETRTEADGRFAMQRPVLSVGQILVEAPGRAPSIRNVGMGSRSAELSFVLHVESTIEGRVLGPDGRPAAGVHVTALSESPWPQQSTRTDAQGTFRIGELPLGPIQLCAEGAGTPAPSLRTRIELGAGANSCPDLLLGFAETISGVAVDAAGAPLKGWFAQLLEEEEIGDLASFYASGRWRNGRIVPVDSSGRFTFGACASGPHRLFLHAPEGPTHRAVDSVRVVAPRPDLRLVAPSPAEHCRLTGELVSEGGSADGFLVVHMPGRALERRASPDPITRSFRFDDLLPGAGILTLWRPGKPPVEVMRFELAPGEARALGRLDVPAFGRVHMEFRFPEGRRFEPVKCYALAQPSGARIAVRDAEELRVTSAGAEVVLELPPGRYRVVSKFHGAAHIVRDLTVEEGMTTWNRTEVRPGARVELQLAFEEALGRGEKAHLRILDSLGDTTDMSFSPTVNNGVLSMHVAPPLGPSEILVCTDSGMCGQGRLWVQPGSDPTRIELLRGTHRSDPFDAIAQPGCLALVPER